MYYKLEITETGKPCGRSDESYLTFNRETKTFKTKEEALAFLDEKYPKCKKVKMYRDDENGFAVQVGRIFCFINADVSHNSPKWFQQDWVELSEVEEKTILF